METEKLLKYELPEWVEFVSNPWLQGIIARYYGKKVNRKIIKYQKRLIREQYLKDNGYIINI